MLLAAEGACWRRRGRAERRVATRFRTCGFAASRTVREDKKRREDRNQHRGERFAAEHWRQYIVRPLSRHLQHALGHDAEPLIEVVAVLYPRVDALVRGERDGLGNRCTAIADDDLCRTRTDVERVDRDGVVAHLSDDDVSTLRTWRH